MAAGAVARALWAPQYLYLIDIEQHAGVDAVAQFQVVQAHTDGGVVFWVIVLFEIADAAYLYETAAGCTGGPGDVGNGVEDILQVLCGAFGDGALGDHTDTADSIHQRGIAKVCGDDNFFQRGIVGSQRNG